VKIQNDGAKQIGQRESAFGVRGDRRLEPALRPFVGNAASARRFFVFGFRKVSLRKARKQHAIAEPVTAIARG
jgi:hypothetical protein